MIPRHIATFLAAGLLLVGCSKRPQFSYDVQEDVSVGRYRDIAWDPRTDILFVEDGKRSVDATRFKAVVLEELQGLGYHLVPADQAKLWLDVFAMRDNAGRSKSPSGMGEDGPAQGHAGMGGRRGSGGSGRPSGGGGMGDARPSGGGEARGPVTLVVALLDPSDTHARWRGVLEVRPDKPSQHGPASPDPADNVRRLLEPLKTQGHPE
jgi:hypothetical protein